MTDTSELLTKEKCIMQAHQASLRWLFLIMLVVLVANHPANARANASVIPVNDPNTPATDDYGYSAGGLGGAVNAVSFSQNTLYTVGNQQFIMYYGGDFANPSNTLARTVRVGRRTIGSADWEIFDTGFRDTNSNATDSHNVATFGIDGDGFMHMSWGVHGNPLEYAKSNASVLSEDPIAFTEMSMNPQGEPQPESRATYPKFHTLPDGDLFFYHRNGSSGNGDSYFRHYDTATQTWVSRGRFYDGTDGATPSNNAYLNRLGIQDDGTIIATWTNRYNGSSPTGNGGTQTNHHFFYAKSTDAGISWTRQDGTPYGGTVSESTAEIVVDVPEGHSMMNTQDMTLDANGDPVIAGWWAPNAVGSSGNGDDNRQYMIAYPDPINPGGQWLTSQITNRRSDDLGWATGDYTIDKQRPESQVRDLARPIVVADDENRVIVATRYRAASGREELEVDSSNDMLRLWYSESLTRNDWDFVDLEEVGPLGNYELVYDPARWRRDGILSILTQSIQTSRSNVVNEVNVVEWDAASFFSNLGPRIHLQVNLVNGQMLLRNPNGESVAIDGYTISDDGGNLDIAQWSSLADQSFPGWDEANPSSSRISELNADGELDIAIDQEISLGTPYLPAQLEFGVDAPSNLTIEITTPGGATRTGIVEFIGDSNNNLILFVDPDTGRTQIVNGSNFSVDIDGYTITSVSDSLDPSDGGWNSFANQDAFGDDWDEANAATDRVSELLQDGASQVASSATTEIGLLFNTTGTLDLEFEFLRDGESLANAGVVREAELGIPGDFNADGNVDLADYTVWRDALGSSLVLANDLTPGSVDADDYQLWRSFFGFIRPGGASLESVAASVPEPGGRLLLGSALALLVGSKKHRKNRS